MNLRERTLRLAAENPELRAQLLPLVRGKTAGPPFSRKWVREVSRLLSLWDQAHPLADKFTVADAMRMGAARWAWEMMEGRDMRSKWLYVTDNPERLQKWMPRGLQRAYDRELQED